MTAGNKPIQHLLDQFQIHLLTKVHATLNSTPILICNPGTVLWTRGDCDSPGLRSYLLAMGSVTRFFAKLGTPGFSIDQLMELAGLSVARSSGSAALDRAALRVVQRAAPFPAPPAGAQRSFSIKIEAR